MSLKPPEDPWRGLDELRARAIVGYDALLAATAKPVVWRWHGVITDAHQTEVSGPSGEGKTTFALLLCAALAGPPGAAVALLGRDVTPVPAGRLVVIVEQENGVQSVRQKLERSCEALGLDARATIDRMVFFVRTGMVINDDLWAQLRGLGRRQAIGALLIDTRATVLVGGESSKEEDQSAISRALMAMIQDGGFPTLTISHSRKGDASDVAGSVQRKAGVDNLLIVRGTRARGAGGRVIKSTVSFEKIRDDFLDEHPEPVDFALVQQDGHWVVDSGGSVGVSPATRAIRAVKELHTAVTSATLSAVAEVMHSSHATAQAALTEACDGGMIVAKPAKGRAKVTYEPRR